MTLQSWIKAQLKYLDGVKHHDPADLATDCQLILEEAQRRATAAGLSVAVMPCRRGFTPDHVREGLAACLAAITTNKPTSDGPLTVPEAAEEMKLAVRTVYQLCKDGQLKHQKHGKAIRITRDAIAQYQRDSVATPRLRHLSL